MAAPIKNITIIGGGTTGWLAALFLSTHFAGRIARGEITVEVVESARVPIIGVGESLSPSMPMTLKSLGVSESAFIKATDATFKLAGYFINWDVGANGKPTSWINPFIGYTTVGYEFERFELTKAPYGDAPDYARTMSPCRDAIEQRKAPRNPQDPEYEFKLRYAYHTDANKFAPFMRDIALQRGARQIIDDVIDVEIDERGYVAALKLKEGGRKPVELVIDATGFASVVLHKALGVPLVSYDKYLLNDRAVVMQLPHEDPNEIEPATRSTALKAGWAFQVPLYHRTGNGYIYSSKFLSDDEAASEFVAYLGPAAKKVEPRTIFMRIGRAERSWVNNCIAMGLASSFVEPLEATAIYSVETAMKWLINYFPDSSFSPALAQRFNEHVEGLFDEVVDFIALHYRISNRADTPYWIAQRNDVAVPDRLAENLAVWRSAVPHKLDLRSASFFNDANYTAALFGKGFYKGGELKPGFDMDKGRWLALRRSIDEAHARALSGLPGHKALLDHIRH